VDTVHECDRQTDGQTDRQTIITITDTVQRIASHGNNSLGSPDTLHKRCREHVRQVSAIIIHAPVIRVYRHNAGLTVEHRNCDYTLQLKYNVYCRISEVFGSYESGRNA